MGESAGSWSVSAHMLANDGDNESLFSNAIGLSGGPLKVEGPSRQQSMFDDLVSLPFATPPFVYLIDTRTLQILISTQTEYVGCANSTNKITCLREAPYEKIYAHQGTVTNYIGGYRSLASAWTLRPSPNDKLVPKSPDLLAATGKISNVPLLMGDMRDEGTLFSLAAGLATRTDDGVKSYFKSQWWPNATDSQLNRLLELYPAGKAGSPYDSGPLNSLVGPQYKRLASIIGDYSFEAQRRQFFAHHPGPIYSYQTEVSLPLSILSKSFVGKLLSATGLSDIPVLGSLHAFDALFYLFGTLPGALSNNSQNIMSTVISFVNHGDPNRHGLEIPEWPRYDTKSKSSYQFRESGPRVIADTYREEAMEYINSIGDSLRI